LMVRYEVVKVSRLLSRKDLVRKGGDFDIISVQMTIISDRRGNWTFRTLDVFNVFCLFS